MTRNEKTLELRRLIAKQFGNLIDRDYVLLGLPYYLNVGDILIWEGEKQFLRTLHHKCLNEGYRYRDYERIKDDTLILLQGGGNFGDLWRFIQDERLRIIQRFQNNPIIITPVTYWYENNNLVQQDAEIMARHPNLTICARDTLSFDLLKINFNNQIMLVPDMAFFIKKSTIMKHVHHRGEGTLFLKRMDKELALNSPLLPKEVMDTVDVHDWPSMEKDPLYWLRYRKLWKFGKTLGRYTKLRTLSRMILKLSDWYFHEHCRKQLVHEGVNFISRYSSIYTTRLHVGILSILLDKEVTIIDNSYGKNSSFFDTWLSDTDGVKLWKTQ